MFVIVYRDSRSIVFIKIRIHTTYALFRMCILILYIACDIFICHCFSTCVYASKL